MPSAITAILSVRDASVQNKALRESAWYFLSIIVVCFWIWISYLIIYIKCLLECTYYDRCSGFAYTNLLIFIQPILSVCLVMTKTDVKDYVLYVLTLSCLRNTALETRFYRRGMRRPSKESVNADECAATISMRKLRLGSQESILPVHKKNVFLCRFPAGSPITETMSVEIKH